MFALTILGNNSAIPAYGRNPTAQFLQTQEQCFLIDCGEGTQLQLSKYKIKHSKITHIFISHLHGDHYFGLIGLLTTMSLLGRTQPIEIYANPLLREIINIQLNAGDVSLSYPLIFHSILKEGLIAQTNKIKIHAFKVQHSVACWGFLFKESKNPRKVIPERAVAYEIPAAFYENLQKGEDYHTKKGTIIPNDAVTIAASRAKSYAYCADTKFDERLIEIVKEVDLLYHETTYLKDMEEKAASRFHSTSIQAATLAKKAQVKKLMIGHFSSKYENIEPFVAEAKTVFNETLPAIEGTCYKI